MLRQLDDHVDLLRLVKLDHHLPAAELAVGLRWHRQAVEFETLQPLQCGQVLLFWREFLEIYS